MLEIDLFNNIYKGKRVLLTGHTGFKGSWLALWLHSLGAEVTGISLAPDAAPNHFDLLKLEVDSRILDIRQGEALARVFAQKKPDIVFHLAAQSLVRRSYRNPIETWSSNVMGTANVLESCRHVPSVRAIVVVTSDKCYDNREWAWGYRENDPLGGYDPYSASKAGAEFVAASYRKSFFSSPSTPLLATARAGNVIGGGDWSEDRLIPDLVRAASLNRSLEIRSPNATRPWQHVLDSLYGYLLLGRRLLQGEVEFAEPWNFGPGRESNRSVEDVLDSIRKHWPDLSWHKSKGSMPHEATLLYLDSSKANRTLRWQPIWDFDVALSATVSWYRNWLENGDVTSTRQLSAFTTCANAKICH